MCEDKFFEPWVKVGAALVWNLWEWKFEENKKPKIIEYDSS